MFELWTVNWTAWVNYGPGPRLPGMVPSRRVPYLLSYSDCRHSYQTNNFRIRSKYYCRQRSLFQQALESFGPPLILDANRYFLPMQPGSRACVLNPLWLAPGIWEYSSGHLSRCWLSLRDLGPFVFRSQHTVSSIEWPSRVYYISCPKFAWRDGQNIRL